MEPRKPASKLNFRKRAFALTANDVVKMKKLERLIRVSILKAKYDSQNADFHRIIAWEAYRRYLSIKYIPIIQLSPCIDLKRDIFSFDCIDCWTFFKSRKLDLPRLVRVLKFPNRCKFDNRMVMSGEEVCLRALYELISGEDQHNIGRNVFGRDQSAQSRAFSYFINHIYETCCDLLVGENLEWWFENGYVDQSRQAITAKLEALGFDSDDFDGNVSWFVDCNCLQTSRVGGGPRGDGEAADRWDNDIQRAFYNGWKSIHGLKHQTCDVAHGFTIDMYGPTSLRRNDLTLLRLSNLNGRMASIQEGNPVQCIGFGDSIYPFRSHLRTYWSADPVPPREARANHGYKSVRISIEWNYGHTSNLFHYLRNLDKLRLMDGAIVVRIYTVCVLLRNCHIALYGGQSSRYFELVIEDDMLEKYMRWQG